MHTSCHFWNYRSSVNLLDTSKDILKNRKKVTNYLSILIKSKVKNKFLDLILGKFNQMQLYSYIFKDKFLVFPF